MCIYVMQQIGWCPQYILFGTLDQQNDGSNNVVVHTLDHLTTVLSASPANVQVYFFLNGFILTTATSNKSWPRVLYRTILYRTYCLESEDGIVLYMPVKCNDSLCRSLLYTAHCTVYTVHCTVYTIYYILYTIQCTLYTVHCTLCLDVTRDTCTS